MDKLIQAASVFNFVIPEWLDDDAIVGKIVGVAVHAGEVRRLGQALKGGKSTSELIDQEILSILQKPVDGPHCSRFIEAIRYYREKTGSYLAAAKAHVEAIRNGSNL